MAFDIEGARKAGYSDDEIADFLGAESKFDVAAARKAGYSSAEILNELKLAPAPKAEPVRPVIPPSANGEFDTGASAEVDAAATPSLAASQLQSGFETLKQAGSSTAAKSNVTSMEVMDRIDRGERVRDVDDPIGYQHLGPQQRAQMRDSTTKALGGNVQSITESRKTQAALPRNPNADKVIQAANEKKWGEAWSVFKDDPLGVMQQLSLESAPLAIPSAVAAVPAAMVGGVPGFVMGMATGSFPVEYGTSIVQALQESGVDTADAAAVDAKLREPGFVQKVGKVAVTRGMAIAAADALGAKLAAPLRGASLAKNIPVAARNVAAEVSTEMGGEALAQTASGEQIKWGEVLAEGLGAGPQAVITTAGQTILANDTKADPVTPILNAPTVDSAINSAMDAVNAEQPNETPSPSPAAAEISPTQAAKPIDAAIDRASQAIEPGGLPATDTGATLQQTGAATEVTDAEARSIWDELNENETVRNPAEPQIQSDVPLDQAAGTQNVPNQQVPGQGAQRESVAATSVGQEAGATTPVANPAINPAPGRVAETPATSREDSDRPGESRAFEDFTTKRGELKVFKDAGRAKVYKAQKTNKVPGNYVPRETSAGWVLSRPAPSTKQIAARKEAGRRLKTLDPNSDTIMQAIRKLGGLRDTSELLRDGADKADLDKYRSILNGKGDSLDGLAGQLAQYGYPVLDEDGNYSREELRQRILESLAGEKIYTAEGQMQRAAKDAELRARAEARNTPRGVVESILENDDADSLAALDIQTVAAQDDTIDGREADYAEFMRAMGATEEEINAEINGSEDQADSGQGVAGQAQGDIRGRDEGREDRAETRQAVLDRSSRPGRGRRTEDLSREELIARALKDRMTGLHNGLWLDENKDRFSHFVAFDADGLKWVNDNMGHGSGDLLLKAYGKALEQVSPETATKLRDGGDEFYILANSQQEAENLAREVESILAQSSIVEVVNGETLTLNGIGVSYGISTSVESADAKLNEAKRANTASGKRAERGEAPPTLVRTPAQGRDDQGNPDAGRDSDQVKDALLTDPPSKAPVGPFHYTDGNKGMASSGSFTADKSRWITFSDAEAQRMVNGDIKPYGASRPGLFVSASNGQRLTKDLTNKTAEDAENNATNLRTEAPPSEGLSTGAAAKQPAKTASNPLQVAAQALRTAADTIEQAVSATSESAGDPKSPDFLHLGWATRNANLAEAFKAAQKELFEAEAPLRIAREKAETRLPNGYKTIPYPERGMPDGVALQDSDGNDIAYPLSPWEAAERAWQESGRADRYSEVEAIENELGPRLEKLKAKATDALRRWEDNGSSPLEPMWEAERLATVEAEKKKLSSTQKAARTRAAKKSPSLELTGETEAEIKAREDAEAAKRESDAKAEQEAEQRAQADRERGNFTLTGSNRAADANPNQDALFSRSSPTFYSELSRQISQSKTNSGPANLWKGMIQNLTQKGVKKDEIEWSGVLDWLDTQQGKVTKEQVQDFIDQNGVQVQDVVLGGSQNDVERANKALKDYLVREKDFTPSGANDYALDAARGELTEMQLSVAELEQTRLINELRAAYEARNAEVESGQAQTKFSQWQLPGGENYRELLLTLPAPEKQRTYDEWLAERPGDADLFGEPIDRSREAYERDMRIGRTRDRSGEFRSSHFDQPNILAHVRFNERTDAEGKRVLFIEEIQSDWAQKGKKDGFNSLTPKEQDRWEELDQIASQQRELTDAEQNEYNDLDSRYGRAGKAGIPSAPFVGKTEAWVSLAVKRMIRYASENGFDRVAFTTGEQQAARYDLSKQVSSVTLDKLDQFAAKKFGLVVEWKDGGLKRFWIDTENDAAEIIGKEPAGKLFSDIGNGSQSSISGIDLKIGGEGMRAFYDKIVPNVVNDVLKKLGGGKLGKVVALTDSIPVATKDQLTGRYWVTQASPQFDTREEANAWAEQQVASQPGFDITPAMREKAMQGMSLFSRLTNPQSLTGLSVEDVETLASKLGIEVSVVESTGGMPAEAVRKIQGENEVRKNRGEFPLRPRGVFMPKTGDIVIVSGNLVSEYDAVVTIVHEAAHRGLRKMFGRDLARALNGIWASNANVRKRASELMKQYSIPQLEATEEVLAELAYEGKAKQLKGWERIVQVINKWLAAAGFNFKLSDEAVETIAAGAAQLGAKADVQIFEGAPAMERDGASQTDSPAFKKWFGKSVVVNPDGKPMVVYHGTGNDFSEFDGSREPRTWVSDQGLFFFTAAKKEASDYSEIAADIEYKGKFDGANVMPVYLSMQRPLEIKVRGDADSEWDQNGKYHKMDADAQNADGVIIRSSSGPDTYIAFRPEQIKSAIGNNGQFDPTNPDIRFSRKGPPGASWDAPEPSKIDKLIYVLQDKQIDMKRVVQGVREAGKSIADLWNPYLQEELYHGRAAKRTQDFIDKELKPLLVEMQMRGVAMKELETFLHNRHAEEANRVLARRNPTQTMLDKKIAEAQDELTKTNRQLREAEKKQEQDDMWDGAAEIEALRESTNRQRFDLAALRNTKPFSGPESTRNALSGISTEDAKKYLAALKPEQRKKYDILARKVDAITQSTNKLLVDYSLESPDMIAKWQSTYNFYVPLFREDSEAMGTGQGFSVSGPASKQRTGSTAPVLDILANIAMQRERAIVRGEKNRVAVALYGLAKQNPNEGFWETDRPPPIRFVNPRTGFVEQGVDPNYKNRDNVVMSRVRNPDTGAIEELAVIFSEDNERAVRMAKSIKNLDANQLGEVMAFGAKITRYFASINTQYNPVFGVINFVRDVQGAAFNLSTTPIAGKQVAVGLEVTKIMTELLKHGFRPQNMTGEYAALLEDFQRAGGQTGFRDLFTTSKDRAKAIESELKKLTRGPFMKSAGAVFDWLNDYNLGLENVIRMAAYKVAIDQGLTKPQAASIAKNLTVNFNRKGQIGQQAGALYAFFNASVQGTARLAETLKGPMGKRIIAGGILLGSMQAVLLAAMGYDEDEPPDFIRERNLIIPLGGKDYLTIPMSLGFHVLPNIGRITTEYALSGFKGGPKRAMQLLGVLAEAFNPIGNAGISMQTVAPTILDPAAAITENRDWQGRPIAKEDRSGLSPTPGPSRFKDTASPWARSASEAINWLSGGTKFVPGVVSPTPDQIDYLIGQVTGGVGREISKVVQTGKSLYTGEELPPYKIPLAGRFYGNTDSQSSQGNKFYANLKKLNEHEAEIKGRRKEGKSVQEYLKDNPDAALWQAANQAEKRVSALRKQKRELVAKDADKGRIKLVEAQITAAMTQFNQRVEKTNKQSSPPPQ